LRRSGSRCGRGGRWRSLFPRSGEPIVRSAGADRLTAEAPRRIRGMFQRRFDVAGPERGAAGYSRLLPRIRSRAINHVACLGRLQCRQDIRRCHGWARVRPRRGTFFWCARERVIDMPAGAALLIGAAPRTIVAVRCTSRSGRPSVFRLSDAATSSVRSGPRSREVQPNGFGFSSSACSETMSTYWSKRSHAVYAEVFRVSPSGLPRRSIARSAVAGKCGRIGIIRERSRRRARSVMRWSTCSKTGGSTLAKSVVSIRDRRRGGSRDGERRSRRRRDDLRW
jgi:hypothetical protein